MGANRQWNFSKGDLERVAREWWEAAGTATVFALHGQMGAGKTTLTAALCHALGVVDPIGSPTFSLVNEYRLPDGGAVYHIDLYRVEDEEEAIRAGIEECLYSGSICIVEWPEKAPGIFPPETMHAWIEATGADSRQLKLEYPAGNA